MLSVVDAGALFAQAGERFTACLFGLLGDASGVAGGGDVLLFDEADFGFGGVDVLIFLFFGGEFAVGDRSAVAAGEVGGFVAAGVGVAGVAAILLGGGLLLGGSLCGVAEEGIAACVRGHGVLARAPPQSTVACWAVA